MRTKRFPVSVLFLSRCYKRIKCICTCKTKVLKSIEFVCLVSSEFAYIKLTYIK